MQKFNLLHSFEQIPIRFFSYRKTTSLTIYKIPSASFLAIKDQTLNTNHKHQQLSSNLNSKFIVDQCRTNHKRIIILQLYNDRAASVMNPANSNNDEKKRNPLGK